MNSETNGIANILNHHEQQAALNIEALFNIAVDFKEYSPSIYALEHLAMQAYHKMGDLYKLKATQGDSIHNLDYAKQCYDRLIKFCREYLNKGVTK